MSLTLKFKRLSFLFSVLVSLTGLLVIVGWLADITLFKSITPDWASMRIYAAFCFILAGITLILVNRDKKTTATKWIAGIFSFIIFLIGTFTILEYIFNFNSGIEELFLTGIIDTSKEFPLFRKSPFSALYFMLFGFCYLPGILERLKHSFCQILNLGAAVIALIAIMDYIIGPYKVFGSPLHDNIVLHSSLSLLLLNMAVLFSNPQKGLMKIISSDAISGKIFRKIFPPLTIIFILTGWLRLKGEKAGYFNMEFGVASFVLIMIIIFGLLLFYGTSSLAKSEKEISLSNQRLEAAEKIAKLGHWEYNMNGGEGIWSKQIFILLGLPIADKAPSFKEFLQFMHPEEREQGQRIFDMKVDGMEISKRIFRSNPANGEIKYFLLEWNVLKDEKENPVKYFGTLQCVTERVKAAELLKQREEQFSKAFHSKVFGLAIVNQERRLVDINDTLADLIEYKREGLIGKTSLEIGLTDPGYIKKRDELLLSLFQKGRIDNYELSIETRNGKKLDLLLSVEPLSLSNKPHWLISLVDVTEKKKAELAIAESEEKYRTLVEQASDGIFIADLQGRFLTVNTSGCKMAGFSNEEFTKMTICDFVDNVYPDSDPFHVAELLAGKVFTTETVMIRKDKVSVFVEATAKMISYGRILVFVRDISERKKAEEQIKNYNEQLKLLTARIENIKEAESSRIGREIHDVLGQQLTVMKIDIAALNKKLTSNETSSKAIEDVLSQVDECFKIIRKISHDLRPSILDDLGLISALEWQAEDFEKRTQIKTKFQSDLSELNLPPDRAIGLFRIFQESLTNVARHAEAKQVKGTLQLKEGTVYLTISDDGKGFDKKTVDSNKSLGLLGMRERTLLMNGDYIIDSAPGRGTEVRVSIPINE